MLGQANALIPILAIIVVRHCESPESSLLLLVGLFPDCERPVHVAVNL
jgi:hypothetical protein